MPIINNFKKSDYTKHRTDTQRRQFTHFFNTPLYNAFAEPQSIGTDINRCIALMHLLDKAYSAGLTRSSHKSFAPRQICKEIFKAPEKLKTLQSIINDANSMAGSLNRDNANIAKDTVRELKKLITEVNGSGLSPNSFAPKFLHFISRAIPPYDSYSRKALTLIRGKRGPRLSEFDNYIDAFLDLMEEVHGIRTYNCTEVKEMDDYLLCY